MAATIKSESESLLAVAKGVNINAGGTEFIVDVPASNYAIRRVLFTNPSTSLAASIATVGVFTATGGGGTTVVAAAVLTTLTAASKFNDRTLAAGVVSDLVTASQLFIRNVVAHGSAATIDVYIFGDILP